MAGAKRIPAFRSEEPPLVGHVAVLTGERLVAYIKEQVAELVPRCRFCDVFAVTDRTPLRGYHLVISRGWQGVERRIYLLPFPTAEMVRQTLENAGIEFLSSDAPGVRLRPRPAAAPA